MTSMEAGAHLITSIYLHEYSHLFYHTITFADFSKSGWKASTIGVSVALGTLLIITPVIIVVVVKLLHQRSECWHGKSKHFLKADYWALLVFLHQPPPTMLNREHPSHNLNIMMMSPYHRLEMRSKPRLRTSTCMNLLQKKATPQKANMQLSKGFTKRSVKVNWITLRNM